MEDQPRRSQLDIYDRIYFGIVFLLVSSPWIYLIFLLLTTNPTSELGD